MPIEVNRRKFLGCSAVAGIAIAQGKGLDGAIADASQPLRLGLVGLGNRGTALLRVLLDLPQIEVRALADAEPRHLARGLGIVEKAKNKKVEGLSGIERMLEREDVDALAIALPCDLHADAYCQTLDAGKHLYGEKPLGLKASECDRVIDLRDPSPNSTHKSVSKDAGIRAIRMAWTF